MIWQISAGEQGCQTQLQHSASVKPHFQSKAACYSKHGGMCSKRIGTRKIPLRQLCIFFPQSIQRYIFFLHLITCDLKWLSLCATAKCEYKHLIHQHIKRYCASLIMTVNVLTDMIADILSSITIIKFYMAHTQQQQQQNFCVISQHDGRTWIKNFKTCRADPDCLQSEGGDAALHLLFNRDHVSLSHPSSDWKRKVTRTCFCRFQEGLKVQVPSLDCAWGVNISTVLFQFFQFSFLLICRTSRVVSFHGGRRNSTASTQP